MNSTKPETGYYKPDISEFHHGFEYERCDDGCNYFKDVFPRAINLELFYAHPERFLPYIRVPLLSAADIEGEGWKKWNVNNYEKGEGKEFNLTFSSENNMCLITKTTGRGLDTNCRTIFHGTIRNRSELKKIQSMIGLKK